MNLKERRRFLRELTRNVLADVLAKAPQMPDDWDGHELRRYLADKFNDSSITLRDGNTDPAYRRRLRAYNNTLLITNL